MMILVYHILYGTLSIILYLSINIEEKKYMVKFKSDIEKILRTLCEYKEVEIIEAHTMKDHIHMLVKIPQKLAVSSFMGY